jgi:hypothetical protein
MEIIKNMILQPVKRMKSKKHSKFVCTCDEIKMYLSNGSSFQRRESYPLRMCLCVCSCMHVCMYVRMYVCMYVCTFAWDLCHVDGFFIFALKLVDAKGSDIPTF